MYEPSYYEKANGGDGTEDDQILLDEEQKAWLRTANTAAKSSSMHKYEKWPEY